jgi:hypothetical protein
MVEHCHCELTHEGLCLKVQISEHGVTVPPTKHSNGVVVDAAAHECHGAACSYQMGADVRVRDARLVRRSYCGVAKDSGDIRCLDGDTLAIMKV